MLVESESREGADAGPRVIGRLTIGIATERVIVGR
jgi:hypothetical protein